MPDSDTEGNGDRRGPRREADPGREPGCEFCSDEFAKRVVAETELVVAVEDGHPVAEGHHLVVPRRHTADFLSMTRAERAEADDLLQALAARVRDADASVEGFNIGANCGGQAGQTVFHAHIHLIPRRKGDAADPRGGIRNVVPHRHGG
jgi:ATP adenylyltransferase